MQVLVLVLNHYEKMGKLLDELSRAGIGGATVLQSTGMAQVLSKESDAFIGTLRAMLSADREDNRTIFMVLPDEKVNLAREVIHRVVGLLDQPGTGILFGVPATFVEGILND